MSNSISKKLLSLLLKHSENTDNSEMERTGHKNCIKELNSNSDFIDIRIEC